MSRGPGRLQQRILKVLGNQPGDRMWWRRLKEAFPREVRDKRFYRAVRGLRRMGRVTFYDEGGFRYLVQKPFYRTRGKIMITDKQLNEILALLPSPREQARAAREAARELEELFEEHYGESTSEVVAYPLQTEKSDLSDHQ